MTWARQAARASIQAVTVIRHGKYSATEKGTELAANSIPLRTRPELGGASAHGPGLAFSQITAQGRDFFWGET